MDAIEWTLDLCKEDSTQSSPEQVAVESMSNLWPGSLAPGDMMTKLIYQLLWESYCIDDLRKEVQTAVNPHGWSKMMLSSLYLQESIIRELNRLHPTGSVM